MGAASLAAVVAAVWILVLGATAYFTVRRRFSSQRNQNQHHHWNTRDVSFSTWAVARFVLARRNTGSTAGAVGTLGYVEVHSIADSRRPSRGTMGTTGFNSDANQQGGYEQQQQWVNSLFTTGATVRSKGYGGQYNQYGQPTDNGANEQATNNYNNNNYNNNNYTETNDDKYNAVNVIAQSREDERSFDIHSLLPVQGGQAGYVQQSHQGSGHYNHSNIGLGNNYNTKTWQDSLQLITDLLSPNQEPPRSLKTLYSYMFNCDLSVKESPTVLSYCSIVFPMIPRTLPLPAIIYSEYEFVDTAKDEGLGQILTQQQVNNGNSPQGDAEVETRLVSYMFVTFGIFQYLDGEVFKRWLHPSKVYRYMTGLNIFYMIGFTVVGMISVYAIIYVFSCAMRFLWLLTSPSILLGASKSPTNAIPSSINHPFLDDTIQPANLLFRSESAGKLLSFIQNLMRKSFTYSTFPLEPNFKSRLMKTDITGSLKNSGIISSSIIPGVTVPLSFLPYIVTSFLISGLTHELGHAIAAITGNIPVKSFGFLFILFFPCAFIEVDHKKLSSSTYTLRLRVLFAGIWHNLALGLIILLNLFCLPTIFKMGFRTGDVNGRGLMVLDIAHNSPLYGTIRRGDTIVAVNDNSLKTSVLAWENALESTMSNPTHGVCVNIKTFGIDSGNENTGLDSCCNYFSQGQTDTNLQNSLLDTLNMWKVFYNFDKSTYTKGVSDSNQKFFDRQCFSSPVFENRACIPYMAINQLGTCSTAHMSQYAKDPCSQMGRDYKCMSPVFPTTSYAQQGSGFHQHDPKGIKRLIILTLNIDTRYPIEDRVASNNIKNPVLKIISPSTTSTFIKVGFIGDPAEVWASVRVGTLFSRWKFWIPLWIPYAAERFLVILLNVTVSLALFNLLPIPTLDGRELLRCALEFMFLVGLVRRRSLYTELHGVNNSISTPITDNSLIYQQQPNGKDRNSMYVDPNMANFSSYGQPIPVQQYDQQGAQGLTNDYPNSLPPQPLDVPITDQGLSSGINPGISGFSNQISSRMPGQPTQIGFEDKSTSQRDLLRRTGASYYNGTGSSDSSTQMGINISVSSNGGDGMLPQSFNDLGGFKDKPHGYGMSAIKNRFASSASILSDTTRKRSAIAQYLTDWYMAFKIANTLPVISTSGMNASQQQQWKFDETNIKLSAERLERISCIALSIILGTSALLTFLYATY